jgi:hypothetical protein
VKNIIIVKGKKVVIENGSMDKRGFITKTIGKDCTVIGHPKKGVFALPKFK